jgi:hypothetical protein
LRFARRERRPLTPDGAAKPGGVPAAGVVSDVAFPGWEPLDL